MWLSHSRCVAQRASRKVAAPPAPVLTHSEERVDNREQHDGDGDVEELLTAAAAVAPSCHCAGDKERPWSREPRLALLQQAVAPPTVPRGLLQSESHLRIPEFELKGWKLTQTSEDPLGLAHTHLHHVCPPRRCRCWRRRWRWLLLLSGGLLRGCPVQREQGAALG